LRGCHYRRAPGDSAHRPLTGTINFPSDKRSPRTTRFNTQRLAYADKRKRALTISFFSQPLINFGKLLLVTEDPGPKDV